MIEVFNEEFSFSSPLRTSVFVNWNGKVQKSQGIQVSKEGIIVSTEHNLAKNADVDLMFSLLNYPDFSELSEDEVFQMELRRNIHFNSFKKDTIRCKGNLVRNKQDDTLNFHSLQFSQVNNVNEVLISEYLNQFTHNLLYLVDIISNAKSRKLLYPISYFLGYDTSSETTLCKVIINDFEKLKT